MTLRNDLKAVADIVRGIAGPSILDQRPAQLTRRLRTWSGGFRGADAVPAQPQFTDVDLVIDQKFRIRQLSTREIANSGGQYEMGDIIVDHITPDFTDPITSAAGGYTEAQLKPTQTENGVELYYVVTGQHAGEYQCVELRSWRAYSYALVLRRRLTTPSVTG